MNPHRFVIIATISAALVLGNNQPARCQSPSGAQPQTQQAGKVKADVQKLGIAEDVTVILLSGKEYYGAISEIEAARFGIVEVDLKQRIAFDYAEVKKVRKGYGGKNYVTGKRVNPRRSLIIGISVVGGLIGLAIWGVSQTR